jgi:hypothetical protein
VRLSNSQGRQLLHIIPDDKVPPTPDRTTHAWDLTWLLHPGDHVNRAPSTIRLTWKITAGTRAPDGVEKRVYLINGELSRAINRSEIWRWHGH